MESIQQVIDRFDFQGKTVDCRAFGNGHINTTYIVTTDLPEGGQQRYVLQKVNHNVFRDIDRLMQNVFAVTSFLQDKIQAAGGDPDSAVRLMLADKMEELMRVQVEAVKGIRIDKVTVWDGGSGKDGKTATADFVSGLMKSIPPMNEMFNMAGMELPRFLGNEKGDAPAQGEAPQPQQPQEPAEQ